MDTFEHDLSRMLPHDRFLIEFCGALMFEVTTCEQEEGSVGDINRRSAGTNGCLFAAGTRSKVSYHAKGLKCRFSC